MNPHQLIRLSPLIRVTRPVGGFPAQRSTGNPADWTAPEGHAYVPILDRPDHDPATQRIVPHLTTESDGWIVQEIESDDSGTMPSITLLTDLDDAFETLVP